MVPNLYQPKEIIERGAWKCCNNMVTRWLIASFERQIGKSIMYFKTASAIWVDLEGRFGNPSSSQMYRLQETARVLFFQSNLSHSFWGDCLLCVAYIINRLPLSCLHHISPYEKIFGTAPINTHRRALGCLCYASTLKPGRTKSEPRANLFVFLGYP